MVVAASVAKLVSFSGSTRSIDDLIAPSPNAARVTPGMHPGLCPGEAASRVLPQRPGTAEADAQPAPLPPAVQRGLQPATPPIPHLGSRQSPLGLRLRRAGQPCQ